MNMDAGDVIPELPDPSVCRGKPAGFGGYVDCLVPTPSRCPHVLRFGEGYFCLHPNREEIAAKHNSEPES